MRQSVFGGPVWPALGMCLGLAVVYFFVASVFMDIFERRARERATLSLT